VWRSELLLTRLPSTGLEVPAQGGVRPRGAVA